MCYLTKFFRHVNSFDTIEFSGFQILESKTAHTHSFYKIIYFILFLNKLASCSCSILFRVKRSGDFQHPHRTIIWISLAFSSLISLQFHYRYIIFPPDVACPPIWHCWFCNDNKPVSPLNSPWHIFLTVSRENYQGDSYCSICHR